MKTLFREFIAILKEARAEVHWPFGSKARNLNRRLKNQSTEDFWRNQQRAASGRLRVIAHRYRISSLIGLFRQDIGTIGSALILLLRAVSGGAILLATLLLAEFFLTRYVWPDLIPSGSSIPPLGAFPTIVVQISASLLGFYLASIIIVLGQSYSTVSADVRDLILGNRRVGLYLKLVGMAIGAGLTLILLQSMGISYGYGTVAGYGLLVVFSGWAFVHLALGAFNLFDPVALGREPLLALYRAIDQLDSRGLSKNEAVVRVASQEANRALFVLAELIDLTGSRVSVDRGHLASMVERLLELVQFYATRKHLLAPTSEWFIREPVYPKWVEANHSETSIALKTSTPLQARLDPSANWLEMRSAELASAALAACVVANDRDSALRITTQVAATAHILAKNYRIDEAFALSAIVRDRCWSIEVENPAAVAAAAAPPLFLANLLLGWREAIIDWPDEIRAVVNDTKWDRRSTKTVRVRGSARVWKAAQQLLREVKAEQDIQGRRATPDWYLRFALADVCIFSLREFAKELPKHLDDFLKPTSTSLAPEVNAMTGSQALQALVKAQLIADALPQAAENLEFLRVGNDRQETGEFEEINELVRTCRTEVLQRTAEALTQLRPDQTRSEPDLFGEALFTLIHHTEEAIATGDVALVKEVFPKILYASFVLQDHVLSTYQPPTHQVNSSILDPTVDILELSGLAIIYATLRGDQSDAPIRQAWINQIKSFPQPDQVAKLVLDRLEMKDGYASLGISPRDVVRTEWGIRLTNKIVEAGYAVPEFNPFVEERPAWNAPPLIKMLGVIEHMRSIFLKPRSIFAAEVIGPLSGEAEDVLRRRRNLRHYYDKKDSQASWDDTGNDEAAKTVFDDTQDGLS